MVRAEKCQSEGLDRGLERRGGRLVKEVEVRGKLREIREWLGHPCELPVDNRQSRRPRSLVLVLVRGCAYE